ncbi:hypothetical protein P171DRAFT_273352 [Karstenula rhodostoma CBS 690.94]|uniref:Uncharacterized protein n=1 Tax=Karstenula rhodostoma CBS 690.94 TaxID=1392251 RepID=A0A9P4UD02_9PLEO|nr:hypothetical protein P171DRAFT_273352 [Karstenula rhodostoma CBS 690.94]
MTQRGLDASWRGRLVTTREYLAFRSFPLAGASVCTPLAAPPIAWTSMAQAPPNRNTAPDVTRLEAAFTDLASTILLICQADSHFTDAKFLSLETVCPPALAPLCLTANGSEACLQPKLSPIHFDTVRQSVVTIHHVGLVCIKCHQLPFPAYLSVS